MTITGNTDEIKVISNPFWEEVRGTFTSTRNRWQYDVFEEYHVAFRESMLRETCCRKYAWAIADPASVFFVAQHLGPRAIEMGAGTGYWSWQLMQAGVEILAFDEAPPDEIPNSFFGPEREPGPPTQLVKTWFPVLRGSCEVLAFHPDRSLLLCWPPYSEPFASECLQAYLGNRLVFIGESDGGCTGDSTFFQLLEKEWEEVAEHSLPQWRHIHDVITVYDRAKERRPRGH